MDAEGGGTATSLAKLLFDKPYRFEFFQAVRLLERIYAGRNPVGYTDGPPSREVVRFRALASLAFPPSQLYQFVEQGEDGLQSELVVAFMGLIGPLGALPDSYTQLLLGHEGARDFLDIFNHRLISLFYRAWEKYRFHIAYERRGVRVGGGRRGREGGPAGEDDPFTEYLFDLIGLGTGGLHGRLGVPDESLLYYGGLIAQRPHSAVAIESILADHFGVPLRLEQFAGRWLELGDSNVIRLGEANSELGVNTVVGNRVWDRQSNIRLRFGPLTFGQFKDFLPTGTAFRPAGSLMRFLVGPGADFDVQLVLKAEEVPALRLDSNAGEEDAPRLGWTSWLKSAPLTRDDEQVVLPAESKVRIFL
jgi:type VI secretion system protein ImpH